MSAARNVGIQNVVAAAIAIMAMGGALQLVLRFSISS